MDDTHLVIGAAWCLVGYACGFGLAVCVFWRRLSSGSADERRRLEQALDDAQAQITRKQAIVDELTAEVANLYAANDRLARKYVEQAGREKARVT